MRNFAHNASAFLLNDALCVNAHTYNMKSYSEKTKAMQLHYLKRVIEDMGVDNSTTLSRKIGVAPSTINRFMSSMEHGKPINALGLQTIRKIEDYSGIRFGSNENMVPVIAEVGAGGGLFPVDDVPLMNSSNGMHDTKKSSYRHQQSNNDEVNCDFVAAPPDASHDVVAVRIKGDSMMPFMEDGTIVYYRQHAADPNDCLNKLCVVMLRDGQAMLKKLRRGYTVGRYNLESYNAVIIEDVEIRWVAKVEHVSFK